MSFYNDVNFFSKTIFEVKNLSHFLEGTSGQCKLYNCFFGVTTSNLKTLIVDWYPVCKHYHKKHIIQRKAYFNLFYKRKLS